MVAGEAPARSGRSVTLGPRRFPGGQELVHVTQWTHSRTGLEPRMCDLEPFCSATWTPGLRVGVCWEEARTRAPMPSPPHQPPVPPPSSSLCSATPATGFRFPSPGPCTPGSSPCLPPALCPLPPAPCPLPFPHANLPLVLPQTHPSGHFSQDTFRVHFPWPAQHTHAQVTYLHTAARLHPTLTHMSFERVAVPLVYWGCWRGWQGPWAGVRICPGETPSAGRPTHSSIFTDLIMGSPPTTSCRSMHGLLRRSPQPGKAPAIIIPLLR